MRADYGGSVDMPEDHFFAESPEECGIDRKKLRALFARADLEVSSGRIEGCQLAVARHGRIAAVHCAGTANGKIVDSCTLFSIYSSTKAIVAVGMWILMERGQLDPSDPVQKHIEEFSSTATVADLLTFTSGLPNTENPETISGMCSNFVSMSTASGRMKWLAALHMEAAPGET